MKLLRTTLLSYAIAAGPAQAAGADVNVMSLAFSDVVNLTMGAPADALIAGAGSAEGDVTFASFSPASAGAVWRHVAYTETVARSVPAARATSSKPSGWVLLLIGFVAMVVIARRKLQQMHG